MIMRGRAAGVALVITLAVLAPGTALAREGPLAVVAGNGRVVIANGDPGCPVTVSADGFSGASVLDANGIAVVDAALAEGTAVAATSAGAGCRPEHAVGVVDNDQVLAEAAASARTGADTVLGLIAAVGAAGIGTALVVAARRKKA